MAWQVAEWLGMTALGTNGGNALLDGSVMLAGAHLRWQVGSRLSFPSGGFDVYRRLNIPGNPVCISFAEWHPVGSPPYSIGGWTLTPSVGSTVKVPPPACDGAGALSLPGAARTLTLDPPVPARMVRVVLSGAMATAPLVEAYRVEGTLELLVDSKVAVPDGAGHLVAELYADRIDRVRVFGTDIVVCKLCYVPADVDLATGWGAPLNGPNPIHLPITNASWPGYHPFTPIDPPEAAARLPVGLAGPVAAAYTAGFVADMHDLLYALVGAVPQHELHQVQPGTAVPSPNARPQPSLRYSVLDLVTLTSVDPNLARILGLYWHDATAASAAIYDYRVVGHWAAELYPATYYDYADQAVGTAWSAPFTIDKVDYQSPRVVTVVSGTWGAVTTIGLTFAAAATWSPMRIVLPDATVQMVQLDVDLSGAGTVRAYRSGAVVATLAVAAGQSTVTIVNAGGVDQLVLSTLGAWTLYRVYTRQLSAAVGDLNYVCWRVSIVAPPVLIPPILSPPTVVAVPSRLETDGTPSLGASAVGLRWQAAPPNLATRRAVRYCVERKDRGNAAAPGAVTATVDLTQAGAVTSAPTTTAAVRPANWPPTPQDFADWHVTPGWYEYRVRSVDIFGRVSPLCPPQLIRAIGSRQPPPPTAVKARWLDADDRWISAADSALLSAASATQGIRVDFAWSGWNRLQSPRVETAGEFLVYFCPGEPNGLLGRIVSTNPLGSTTELVTDQTWLGAANLLTGELLRVGGRTFEVTANTTGAAMVITVKNLENPAEEPGDGPFVLRFGRTGANFQSLSPELAWVRRVHAEPALTDGPWVGAVLSVTAVGDSWEIGTDIAFASASADLLAGVLVCAGVTYRATAQARDGSDRLVVTLDSRTMPDDTDALPAVGQQLRYHPGRQYSVLVTSETLVPEDDYPVAMGQVGVSASDGETAIPDAPEWAAAPRGGMGGHTGNKSRVSVPCRIVATRTATPGTPTASTATSTPEYADPADWYGMANYTLSWAAVAGAGGYHVFRATGANLFLRDREMRRLALGPYAADPFPDEATYGYDADAWLAENTSLARAALQSPDLALDPDGNAVMDAWRAFAEWFYPQLDDAQVQALADTAGNEQAFRRINTAPVDALSYDDHFEARGRGFVLYRVRALDDSGNQSMWGGTHPPVHLRRVTPPRSPVLVSVTAGENQIGFTWTAVNDPDLQDYLLWRASNPDDLADVRWEPEPEVLTPAATGPTETYTDTGLVGATDVYYRLAARDTFGNVSAPTPVFSGRAVDTTAPLPPEWETVEWRKIRVSDSALLAWEDPEDPAETYTPVVYLQCLADEAGLEFVIERKGADGFYWSRVGDWTEADDPSDPEAEDARRFTAQDTTADSTRAYTWRMRVRDGAGNVNRTRFETFSLAAP